VFPSPAARQLPPAAVADRLRAALAAYNAAHPHTSERIARALVVAEPLSLDDGETTDKGYTNQRRVLERRAAAVDQLFAQPPGADVLAL
jgi:feruloyl-CoA synthase